MGVLQKKQYRNSVIFLRSIPAVVRNSHIA